jgi:hypothetical protein
MKQANSLPAGITQEMITAAIEKYGTGKVATAQLPKDDNGTDHLNVVIHQPGREAMGQYMNLIDKNTARANEVLVKACIDDKEAIKEIFADTGLFLAAVDACAQLIPVRKSIIKNF